MHNMCSQLWLVRDRWMPGSISSRKDFSKKDMFLSQNGRHQRVSGRWNLIFCGLAPNVIIKNSLYSQFSCWIIIPGQENSFNFNCSNSKWAVRPICPGSKLPLKNIKKRWATKNMCCTNAWSSSPHLQDVYLCNGILYGFWANDFIYER